MLAQWLRRLLTFLVPLAFVAYFPAARLLGKPTPLGLPDARSPGPRRSSPSLAVLVARRRLAHSPSATTGAPGADVPDAIRSSTSRGLAKTFVVQRKAGRVRRRREEVTAVAGIDLADRARRHGRLHRPERGREVDDHQDAHRHPRAQRRARPRRRPRAEPRSAPSWPVASAWCSGSARSSGGTCRCATASTCCATCTGCPPTATPRTSARFADGLDLGPLLDVPVRQLSLGQRMRGELTAALLHDPSILLLDEPTIGLDVVSKEAVREFLVDVNREQGTTVLLTTHDLADVERLCERLLIIDHGTLIEDSTVAGITARYGTERTLVVDLAEPGPPLEIDGRRGHRVDGPAGSGCGSDATT